VTDDERLSLALPFRFEGRLRYLLARMEFTLEDGELLTDSEDMFLTFASSQGALAFAARRFPEIPAATTGQKELATLRRGLEEMYAPAVHLYELDAAAEWARQPGGPRPDPVVLLEAWRLIAWAGLAPEPARYDPMGLAGLYMSRSSDEEGRARDALIETSMKLDGIVRDRERVRNRGESPDDQWAEHETMWSVADAERVAGILSAGLNALSERLREAGEP
jgi:hypothetical protein